MIEIQEATKNDITVIQKIAEKTWWPTYSSILTEEQLRYMLEKIYSTERLTDSIENGPEKFLLLVDDSGCMGFCSYSMKSEYEGLFKLNKLYVLPETHGKGYGRILINEVKKRLPPDAVALDLNVNRFNPAKGFYEKYGFQVIGEEDVPVGPYWMNDFVMRLSLHQP